MKRYQLGFISSLTVIILIIASTINSHSLSCFPTCSSTDGRFLAIAEGLVFLTLTPSTLNIRLVIPEKVETFELGIFDGDHLSETGGRFHWDNGDINNPGTYDYLLMADPDRDNNGPVIFSTVDTDLPDNAWRDFTITNHPDAIDGEGNYVYTFSIILTNGVDSANQFKLRTSEGVLTIEEIFTFIANITSPDSDVPIVFPNVNFDNGISEDDLVGTTYDGSFTFFFTIDEDAVELVFWDGDSDRGSFNDMSTQDTDDLNTPNEIPPFAPPDADTVAEKVNISDPKDDIDPAEFGGFGLFFQRSPSIEYTIIFPDGQEFTNNNPSGNREWENFVMSTLSSDPNIVDVTPPSIPPGDYQIRFEGLDMGNFVSINPLFPLVLRGENDPDPETIRNVPTISEWGLISVAVLMGVIGILVVRKRQQQLS